MKQKNEHFSETATKFCSMHSKDRDNAALLYTRRIICNNSREAIFSKIILPSLASKINLESPIPVTPKDMRFSELEAQNRPALEKQRRFDGLSKWPEKCLGNEL